MRNRRWLSLDSRSSGAAAALVFAIALSLFAPSLADARTRVVAGDTHRLVAEAYAEKTALRTLLVSSASAKLDHYGYDLQGTVTAAEFSRIDARQTAPDGDGETYHLILLDPSVERFEERVAGLNPVFRNFRATPCVAELLREIHRVRTLDLVARPDEAWEHASRLRRLIQEVERSSGGALQDELLEETRDWYRSTRILIHRFRLPPVDFVMMERSANHAGQTLSVTTAQGECRSEDDFEAMFGRRVTVDSRDYTLDEFVEASKRF
jgi:hypothetical protein